MRRGLEWYKRDPRAMIDAKRAANNGAGMTIRQAAVYDLVTDLLYEGAGETPNNPQHIASHFKDMGSRAARETISELIVMGKLHESGGMLRNNRASEQARSRQQISEARSDAGRKGGEKSAETRRKLADNPAKTERNQREFAEFSEPDCNEISHLTEANASSKNQPDKRREEKNGSGDGTRARASEPPDMPTDRELLLQAMGVDPVSGIIGPSGKMIGRMADMQEFQAWRDDLGLSMPDILTIIAEVMQTKADGPPKTFSYFTEPMRRAAGRKARPALVPIEETRDERTHGSQQTTGNAKVSGVHQKMLSGFVRAVPQQS